ncbi:MAG: VIT family protein [Beijerinckiaceae bacterium]|jgi:VIT1/CCC1 family predicted Fe2+/Mn2+ transporter
MSQSPETHRIARIGWLRAAVLGANDGIISTASLIVGVASADGSSSEVLITGVAGLVAGAMSMAAGEFVSVSSQADTEEAELARETLELAANPVSETQELMDIYVARGVTPDLAYQVAEQLMFKDALGAHARDELGISEVTGANPVQAAFASAITFATGAFLPILAVLVAPRAVLVPSVFGASLACLALLGALGAKAGGAGMLKPAIRVAFWGALAMAITAGAGALIGNAV